MADDSPDLELNPSTGLIESVSVSAQDGGRVLHVEDSGQGGPLQATIVSAEPASDSRIAIKPNGESWAAWKAQSGEIRCAYRDAVSKAWTVEKTVSVPGEPSRRPSIAHNQTETWIAYEIDEGNSTAIAASVISDSPEPWPMRTLVASTSSEEPDVVIRSESGHVWVSWVASARDVGWAEYDRASDTWDAPQLEAYGASTVEQVREAIRSRILTP